MNSPKCDGFGWFIYRPGPRILMRRLRGFGADRAASRGRHYLLFESCLICWVRKLLVLARPESIESSELNCER